MLIDATELQWKQFCAGLGRDMFPQIEQENCAEGRDLLRSYKHSGEVMAVMRVVGGNSDAEGGSCFREYRIDTRALSSIKDIPILTDAAWAVLESVDDQESWLREKGFIQ